jgi:hypothetical protein
MNVKISLCICFLVLSIADLPARETEQFCDEKSPFETIIAQLTPSKAIGLMADTISPILIPDSLMQAIWNSKMVQQRAEYVIVESKGQRKLVMNQEQSCDEIIVRLVEDNGVSFATHFTFFISPLENWRIELYEPLDDRRVPFEL